VNIIIFILSFGNKIEIYKNDFLDALQVNLEDIIKIVFPLSSELNVFSGVQEYLLYYQESLNHITEYQKFAMIHILASVFILLCLSSLITVFIGNSLIEYFKLGPKLAKYIQLRQKFQTYYFIINSLLIISMLVVIIIINIIAFNQDI